MSDPDLDYLNTGSTTAQPRGRGGQPQLSRNGDGEAKPSYGRLDLFVEDIILRGYRRDTNTRTHNWCPQWWRHGEAQARLDALWRTWEVSRQDPATGVSNWWRQHADHHMAKLLDPEGPFRHCSARNGHKQMPPLPHDPPPAGYFDNRGRES